MNTVIMAWNRLNGFFESLLSYPQTFFLLVSRLWVAWIFFKSGMLKLQSWDVTLELFQYEYNVPLLAPTIAAILATLAELCLPPLLALGIFSRPAALLLLFVNMVAAISYPDISIAGMKDHYLWGLVLLWVVFLGGGKLAIDFWLAKRRVVNP